MPEWLRRRVLPWAMWGGTMIAAASLWCGLQRVSATGHVVRVDTGVAPARAGRVASLEVEVGDLVRAGQVIATLDAAEVEAELAILAAERQRIEAQLGATQVGAEARESATTRDLDESLSSAELALRAAKARRKVKSAELSAVSAQVKRLRDLVDARMADRRELDALVVRQAGARNEVDAADSLISQLVGEVASARGRRGALDPASTDVAAEPLKAELEVLDRRQDLLELRRDELVLRAPSDGEVSAVLVRPGEVVGAGAPVVTIVGAGGPRVSVCLSEVKAAEVTIGEATKMTPRGKGAAIRGHVRAIGAHVGQLPSRCWRDPQVPEWGREVTIAVDEGASLLAGQSFHVVFEGTLASEAERAGDRAPVAAASATEARASDADAAAEDTEATTRPGEGAPPALMTIPGPLAERTRVEPSAALWWPSRGRYLVVSDDTGLADRDEHAPWLLTLAPGGALDPEPLVLGGIDEVNDLEAIAPGPSDSLYLLASQSRSRKGKRPPSRQVFAEVKVDASGGVVTGAVHLADLLAAADPEVREALGVADLDALDLEGMSASQDGGLLIGVKAPLGARDEALIWRLGRPDRLLADHSLAAAELRLWGTVPLRVRADGAEVAGGIAELLELPDRSLLLASTASGIDPTTQSGSLWHVRSRARLSAPFRIREYEGQKPEGLALGPDGKTILVVFDAGDETPLWQELPWPAR
ncbi:MAG: HlyD family efflux transporter periplasmic adaptor subunit [Nannocystaceae bacterium]